MPRLADSHHHRGSESSDDGFEHEKSRERHYTLWPTVSQANRADTDGIKIIEIEDDAMSQYPRKTISWEAGDPENPYNWTNKKKTYIVIVGALSVINSTLGSSLPSNAIPFISKAFHITSSYAQILPISMYLFGYIVGPLVFGPLSESCGRRYIMSTSFVAFTIFTLGCAVAPTWEALLFNRLLAGVTASSPVAVTGGIFADIYADPVARGRAMAAFIGAACVGPLIAPPLSGFISPALGWRWTFWVGFVFACVTLAPVLLLPETYGPVLLARRAARLRKETGSPDIVAPFDLGKEKFQINGNSNTRPTTANDGLGTYRSGNMSLSKSRLRNFLHVLCAYPIVFQGIYKQSPGVSGLTFLPIGVGTIGATILFLSYDSTLRKAQALKKPWTQKEESRRLPLACVGGPLFVVGLFWLGWTAKPQIPYYVPMLAGIPSGMGFVLIFMALLNYLADAYEIYAASAMAAASCARSVAGALLPFAAEPMYRRLGVQWATSVLAFLSLAVCAIPWVFLWKGDTIREGSKFCRALKEKREREAMEQGK
ncbi:hypothetical protein HYALB_00000078 [Hymenoscyphus albidus]|uniref:Major facilitator superfamily (MFS) profile domain-containing protein n=1 Tax=Hymenoscyphus albidus TaxID=595503 RepID=A0A9N9LIQ5_9HELO|nr:hypothetical protein HYALB_00000078 [Hymenoscyphus albidus]